MDTYETLLYEEEDGVATVTLNRPEVHNAFDQRMQAELRVVSEADYQDWLKARAQQHAREMAQ